MDLDKLAFIMSLKNNVNNGGSSQPIDTQVNGESENAVQNKAIWEFVNSSVASNTAYFKGTYSSVAELETIADVTNNDYAFVISVDDNGNTVYNRYKYSNNNWMFEYALNNSSFTANQWNTINSGITSDDIQNLEEGKVDKETGKGLSANDFTDEDKEQLLSLTGIRSEIAVNRSTLGYSAKNLLKNGCGSRTSFGVTAAVNANGTITLNGTSEKAFVLYASVSDGINNPGDTPLKKVFPDGEYYLSGGISGKAYMQLFSFDETRTGKLQYGGKVTVNGDYPYNCVRITVDGGKTFDNEIIYPMLRCADITDDTYEPYKPSVEERLAALEAAIMGGA